MRLSSAPIDVAAVRAALQDESCGALVLFEGWVRDHNEGRAVRRLAYEAYEPLALSEGEAILAEAAERWPIGRALCVHRTGELALGEVAVIVGVASAHRDAAFQAGRYIIDEAKTRLPIWKKEFYADGESEWINCRVERVG